MSAQRIAGPNSAASRSAAASASPREEEGQPLAPADLARLRAAAAGVSDERLRQALQDRGFLDEDGGTDPT